jgi:hypothetical protein
LSELIEWAGRIFVANETRLPARKDSTDAYEFRRQSTCLRINGVCPFLLKIREGFAIDVSVGAKNASE